MGKVGDDAFGKMLLGTLQKAGIDTRGMVTTEEVFTTLAFVTLDETGNREFSFSRKPGADTCLTEQELDLRLIDETKVFHFGTLSLTHEPARSATYRAVEYARRQGKWITFDQELDLRLIDETKVFHFGTLSLTHEPARSATYRAVEYARRQGKWITFDPNLRKPLWKDLDTAKEQMRWGLSQADVVKISDEEVAFLFGMTPEEGAAHILREFGGKLVFVTCGARGCFFQNRRTSGMVPGLTGLSVVDTTGAGDIFGGSALWMLLQTGEDPAELAEAQLRRVTEFACASAGLSTTRYGGISSVPSYEQVMAVLNRT